MNGFIRLAVLGLISVSVSVLADAPPVEVQTLQSQLKRSWVSTSGRLTAVEVVEIRPQVGGRIDQILFEEGSSVEQGQLLLVIDPRPYQAAVDRARAKLESAQAQSVLTAAELRRAQELLNNKLSSQSQYDLRKSEDLIARANITAAKADLADAELQLEYANIRAPISGRIGRAEITRGNVIAAGAGAPILATIVGSAEVFAEFDLSERDYLNLQRVSKTVSDSKMPVELSLGGDVSDKIYLGSLHAFDNRVDSRTGTIRARALFENSDGLLIPGIFAELRLGSASAEPMLLVSQRAISTDQNKKFVYTLDTDNKVVYNEVVLGQVVEGYRRVLSGLKAGDRVVVNGLQRLQPTMQVAPTEVKPSAPVAAQAPAY